MSRPTSRNCSSPQVPRTKSSASAHIATTRRQRVPCRASATRFASTTSESSRLRRPSRSSGRPARPRASRSASRVSASAWSASRRAGSTTSPQDFGRSAASRTPRRLRPGPQPNSGNAFESCGCGIATGRSCACSSRSTVRRSLLSAARTSLPRSSSSAAGRISLQRRRRLPCPWTSSPCWRAHLR